MAFNTKVDVADTELEADETVTAQAEDVTPMMRTRMMRKRTSPRTR